jgi:hypothetical protein
MAAPTDRLASNRWLLAVAPLALFLFVIGVWTAIDRLLYIGPFDRAQLGWAIAAPLTIAVPVVAAWAGGRLGRLGRPFLAVVLGIAAALAIGWPFWVQYASQCAAVGLPMPVASIAIVGVIGALTMGGAVIAAGAAFDRSRPRLALVVAALASVIVFAIGFLAFALTFLQLFFGECVVRPSITP